MIEYDPLHPLRTGITLLEASAGTGKTYGITDLVVRLVAETGASIREILIVTFTRAATAELRDRVRRRINEAIDQLQRARHSGEAPCARAFAVFHHVHGFALAGPGLDTVLLRLERAREDFDEAAISTIHGFCQRALSRCALETRLAFDAELTRDLSSLLEEIVDDFRAVHLRDADLDWYRYVNEFAGIDRTDMLRLAAVLEADPEVEIVAPAPDANEPASPRDRWWTAWAKFEELWCSGVGRAAAEMLTAASKSGVFEGTRYGPRKTKSRADEISQTLELPAAQRGGLDSLVDKVALFAHTSMLADAVDPDGLEIDPQLHELFSLGDIITYDAADQLRRQFIDFVRVQLSERKQIRNILSYNDLLHRLAEGLDSNAEVLMAAIRQEYSAALIDEFQDTDPVQWRIFSRVFGRDAYLYLIGDPKQAIYAFRGADIFTYIAAKRHADAGTYTMATNWRSDRPLVLALNHILGQRGVFAAEGIEYIQVQTPPSHDTARLVGPSGALPALHLEFFARSLEHGGSDDEPAKAISRGWASKQLPVQVASDIVELLASDSSICDEAGQPQRVVAARDIAVIVRRHREGQLVQKALARAGVPSVIAGAGRIYHTPQALWIQRCLRALIRPNSTRQSRAAWATPLFGARAQDFTNSDTTSWDRWLLRLSGWAKLAREHGFMRAFRKILVDEGVVERLLSDPNGERAMTNVQHLAELLHAAQQSEELSLEGLSAWLERRRSGDGHDADTEELRLETDAHAVAIVTIHRSKGLEYPVVYCPFLWVPSPMDGKFGELRNLSYHEAAPPHQRKLDLRWYARSPDKAQRVELAQRERFAENLRLAYVALTRARHRCVIYCGAFKGAQDSPLAAVLHSGVPPERTNDAQGRNRIDAASARMLELSDAQLLRELEQLVESGRAVGTQERVPTKLIEVRRASPPTQQKLPAEHQGHTATTAREFSRSSLDRAWRRSSFSAMIRHGNDNQHDLEGSPEVEGIDHDAPLVEHIQPARPTPADSETTPVVLNDFPRGADEGTFLHAVLEDVDFADLHDSLDEVLEPTMRRHHIDLKWRSDLERALTDVIHTPLGHELAETCLADISRRDRLDELSFDFPIAGGLEPLYDPQSGYRGLSGEDLASVFDLYDESGASPHPGYGERIRALRFDEDLRGFLTGSIDLVFRQGQGPRARYYLVDYKSNWIGQRDEQLSTLGDYDVHALAKAMRDHHYVLQYHLYTVALHRYLGWRLGDSYDYDIHLGGVRYLFLRGMAGRDAPLQAIDPDGLPLGIYATRPDRTLIAALDECLRDPVNWRRVVRT